MALVDTLAVRLGEMGMQTLTETLVKAEANALRQGGENVETCGPTD